MLAREHAIAFAIAISFQLSIGCAPQSAATPKTTLPKMISGSYRVDPYIEMAIELQSLGRNAAIDRLHLLANEPANDDGVKVLCRMLFKPRSGGDFRPPGMGAVSFCGDTSAADWPLAPIEIVDGVPFLIIWDYSILGYVEEGAWYLEYCQKSCDWVSTPFKSKSKAEKTAALQSLLLSTKWKRKLNAEELHKLSQQIE